MWLHHSLRTPTPNLTTSGRHGLVSDLCSTLTSPVRPHLSASRALASPHLLRPLSPSCLYHAHRHRSLRAHTSHTVVHATPFTIEGPADGFGTGGVKHKLPIKPPVTRVLAVKDNNYYRRKGALWTDFHHTPASRMVRYTRRDGRVEGLGWEG